MTETSETAAAPKDAPKRRGGSLNSMLIADLKSMAAGMGIPGSGSMKKAQLVEAIKAARAGAPAKADSPARETGQQPKQDERPQQGAASQRAEQPKRAEQSGQGGATQRAEQPQQDQASGQTRQAKQDQQPKQRGEQDQQPKQRGEQDQQPKSEQRPKQDQPKQGKQEQPKQKQGKQKQDQPKQEQDKQGQSKQDQKQDPAQQEDGQEDGGSRRNRRRRGRDRTTGRSRNEPDTQILEDDVLVPAAGILDVLDNYAFVRTSGYLPGPDDVYLSLSLVRKFGMRRGDAVVGQVRQPREGERKEKFNPMVRIDSVNGQDPEASGERPEFEALTPVHPTERLRLETRADELVGRVIDLAAPVGKGQRGLILAPPEAGRTFLLHAVASAIAANNPECHLMVVLVDERPEEVTDFQRSVKGEVVASTLDRQPSDHVVAADLAVERAKRLVELGHDVVVLLDSLTRLGRAHNLVAPANGRVLPSGVDTSALHAPKKVFGAARNIEDGGSLTILATALVETGSAIDDTFLDEVKGAANMELRLSRDLADQRVHPAVDVLASGTRHEDQLLGDGEASLHRSVRRMLAGKEPQPALETLLGRLRKSQSNVEFLTRVQKSAQGSADS